MKIEPKIKKMNAVDAAQVVILRTLEVKVPKPVQYIHNVYNQYTNTQPEILFCIFKIKVENEQKKYQKIVFLILFGMCAPLEPGIPHDSPLVRS